MVDIVKEATDVEEEYAALQVCSVGEGDVVDER